jgi:hypothetical protein
MQHWCPTWLKRGVAGVVQLGHWLQLWQCCPRPAVTYLPQGPYLQCLWAVKDALCESFAMVPGWGFANWERSRTHMDLCGVWGRVYAHRAVTERC